MKLLGTLLVAASAALAMPSAYASQDPLTIEDFATRPVMNNVSLSPDGERLAYRVAQNRTGDYYIEVRDVDDLGADPVRLGSENMDITGFQWLNSDLLRVQFQQQVRDRIEGQNSGVFQSKQAIVRADGRGRFQPLWDDLQVYSTLPDRENEILVYTAELNYEDANRDALRASGRSISGLNPDFSIMNLRNRSTDTVLRGNNRRGGYRLDYNGNIRISQTFDPATRETIYWQRGTSAESEWQEFNRVDVEDQETQFSVLAFDPQNSNNVFVSANRGEDVSSIYEYNIVTGEFGGLVFSYNMIPGIPHQDIQNGWYSSDPARNGEITGFVYYDADGHRQVAYIDPEEQALADQLAVTFPGKSITISSRSMGGAEMVIFTESELDPGTYYLFANGRLQLIGQRRPHIEEEQLAEVRYIEYEARDGRTIPGYLTVPHGEGPFPLVIMPHGGPWVPYRTPVFEEWGQFLASQGYMVLEPLFRGTTGLGVDHWTSAFGEWGRAMSDDMDDGALYLVEQGMADRDRLAMWGWSFGGYSSFAAATRTPQIYQCVIAGAGVGDPVEFRAFFTRNRVGRDLLERGYEGLNTVASASEMNVPILVVHGDLDQRVRLYHSEAVVAELERYGKPHRFVILEGADHFDNTLTFDHRVQLYTEMTNFFRDECGPGGL